MLRKNCTCQLVHRHKNMYKYSEVLIAKITLQIIDNCNQYLRDYNCNQVKIA